MILGAAEIPESAIKARKLIGLSADGCVSVRESLRGYAVAVDVKALGEAGLENLAAEAEWGDPIFAYGPGAVEAGWYWVRGLFARWDGSGGLCQFTIELFAAEGEAEEGVAWECERIENDWRV